MSLFYKYQFNTKLKWDEIKDLLTIDDQDKNGILGVVNIGYLKSTEKIAVDILWRSEENPILEPYKVKLGIFPPVHLFAGVNYTEQEDEVGIQVVIIDENN
jgi:hypothetical protein